MGRMLKWFKTGRTATRAGDWTHKRPRRITPRGVTDCPRPEACVIAHECRECGAPAGEPCR